MRPLENVIYNQKNIDKWESEIPHLEKEIIQEQKKIAIERESLAPLQQQLTTLDLKIGSLNTLILSQQLANISHHHHSHHHNHHHHGHDHHRYDVVDFMSDSISRMTLVQLQSELSIKTLERDSLDRQMEPHRKAIANSERRIRDNEANIQWRYTHIPLAKKFLERLNNNPADLVNSLHQKLLNDFRQYEDHHPAGLSPRVRFCLLNIEEKLKELYTAPALSYLRFGFEEQQRHQINYLRLCGFILDMYRQVKAEGQSEEFTDLLIGLVNDLHIGESDDLPDLLATGVTAQSYFQAAKGPNKFLCDLNDEQLVQYEATIFRDKYTLLSNNSLFGRNSVQLSMAKAMSLIADEINGKILKNEPVDYHFYTAVTNDFLQIFTPQSEKAIKHLGVLAEHASGAPSLGKQIGGALLVVIGLTILTASIVGLAATFGGSSFFSAYGIGLGLSMLQFQVAFGTLFTATTFAGSGLTFFGGRVYKQGTQQGLSKELAHLQEECQKPNPLDYSQVTPSAPPLYPSYAN
ncbi:hypothetical protein [Legionella hackeliae]|uniref:Uncharacterized protein n=1 Tax=Legionella hackeliae TaxID=449 RepID=A0A0A8UTB2_LEGHA|nr:hypothetical protein [Legionella hackeliae]KTD08900.1 hypothetical protein Lhac_3123 [Legionella hackeliae]CEK10332.1 conserved protein of unknown function [Legionella hackeliae]STX47061.1 Uncharacterised protein [Legionella hackeliae]